MKGQNDKGFYDLLHLMNYDVQDVFFSVGGSPVTKGAKIEKRISSLQVLISLEDGACIDLFRSIPSFSRITTDKTTFTKVLELTGQENISLINLQLNQAWSTWLVSGPGVLSTSPWNAKAIELQLPSCHGTNATRVTMEPVFIYFRRWKLMILMNIDGLPRVSKQVHYPHPPLTEIKDSHSVPDHITFTKREREVLELLGSAKSSRQIAEILHISEHTVKNHRKNMLYKADVNTTVELLNLYYGGRYYIDKVSEAR